MHEPPAENVDVPVTPARYASFRWAGLLIAGTVFVAWGALLTAVLAEAVPAIDEPGVAIAIVLLQAFLYTGLFITAHEAMHGLVTPGRPRLNDFIGRVALLLFAALPYPKMRRAHLEHHRVPSTDDDPDYHEGQRPPILGWYVRFLMQYVTPLQILVMAAAFNALRYRAGISVDRLLLFWIAPQVISTWQLFLVGTWLPHRVLTRGRRGGQKPFDGSGSRKARSVNLPVPLSLLACFHFGYHYEHHAFPFVPWWRLPAVRSRRVADDADA